MVALPHDRTISVVLHSLKVHFIAWSLLQQHDQLTISTLTAKIFDELHDVLMQLAHQNCILHWD